MLMSPQLLSRLLQHCYLFPAVTHKQKSYCIKHTYQLGNCSATQTKTFTCTVDELADYERTTSLTVFIEGERNIRNVITIPVFWLFCLFGWW